MSLSLKELVRQLEHYSPEVILDCNYPISTVRFFNKEEISTEPGILLIGNAKDLPEIPPVGQISFLVAGTSIPDSYMRPEAGCTLVSVSGTADTFSLCNTVWKLLEEEIRTSKSILKLLKVKKSKTTLQELLDLGYEILGNPLLLVDVSLCFIAHAGGNTPTQEPLWEWTLSKGYVTDQYIEQIHMDMMEDLSGGSKADFVWEKGILNHDQLVYKIKDNGKPVAYLKVLALNKPISDSDLEIVEALGNSILYFLLESTNTYTPSSPLAESFLIALLNEKLYDKDAIEERIHQFNIKLYDYISVIVVELTKEYMQDINKIYVLKRVLQNFLARNTIVYYKGFLVAIFDTKTDSVFTESDFQQFNVLLEKQNCRAGISYSSKNLYSLPEQFSQAVAALNTAWKLHRKERVIRYCDYLLPHIFLNYADRGSLNYLIHPALKDILKLDTDKQKLFLETIRGYIENGTEMSVAAKKMYLNYNTLKYRVNRIVEMTGLDFGDSQTIFQLHLSFMILDMKNQMITSEEADS